MLNKSNPLDYFTRLLKSSIFLLRLDPIFRVWIRSSRVKIQILNNFLTILHPLDPNFLGIRIVGRGFLTPLFNDDPLYFLPPPPPSAILSQVLPKHSPLSPSTHFVALFLWLNVSWHNIYLCDILLNDMDLNLLSLGTLVPATPCVFYAARHQVY